MASRRAVAEATYRSGFAANTRVGVYAYSPAVKLKGLRENVERIIDVEKNPYTPGRGLLDRAISGLTGAARDEGRRQLQGATGGPNVMPSNYLDPNAGGLPNMGGGGSGYSACDALGIPRSICDIGGRIVDRYTQPQEAQCPQGTVLNPNNGVCEYPGSPGDISTPGGPSGGAVMGVFGAPAVPAQVVGEITRTNGQQTLIRRCPTGLVLGKDNLCYAKGSIPNKLRKWPKAPKAPVTAYDAKMMRRYGPGGSKQNSIKKLAGNAGLTCKKR